MELSKEEKKAIEELEEYIEDDEIQNISVFTAKKIKNIIEQQQKEIEEKNKDIKKLNDLLMLSELDYISKDKIRKKLNYYENSFDYDDDGTSYGLVMEVLDELLEEK